MSVHVHQRVPNILPIARDTLIESKVVGRVLDEGETTIGQML
jgi:hypothetical protein